MSGVQQVRNNEQGSYQQMDIEQHRKQLAMTALMALICYVGFAYALGQWDRSRHGEPAKELAMDAMKAATGAVDAVRRPALLTR